VSGEPPLVLIRCYYAGCNAADRAAMQATFCDDVVHYFTHHAPELMRGAEWYRLRDGRIGEIRAYYLNRHAPYERRHFELDGFDYAGRGYPVLSEQAFSGDCLS
jgi:hypothetical protein